MENNSTILIHSTNDGTFQNTFRNLTVWIDFNRKWEIEDHHSNRFKEDRTRKKNQDNLERWLIRGSIIFVRCWVLVINQ